MGVILRGVDTGVEYVLPSEEKIINSDCSEISVNIPSDKYSSTAKTVHVRSGIINKKFISFGFNLLKNSDMRENNIYLGQEYDLQSIKYPQRHVIDIIIYGANGPNGFLLTGSGDTYGSNYLDDAKLRASLHRDTDLAFPTSISSATKIIFGDSSGLKNDDWFVREHDGWGMIPSCNYDSGTYEIGIDTNQTCDSNIVRTLAWFNRTNEDASTERVEQTLELHGGASSDILNRILLYHKYTNFLYSQSNVVKLRFTLDVKSVDDKNLTIEKFQSGSTLS